MVSLSDAVSLLQTKRKELSDQLDAVDKALAALGSPLDASTTGPEENPQETVEETASEVPTIRLKSPRTLSDEHAYALQEGGRRARHLKEAVAGRAREIPDPRPGLAPASSADGQRPRLVKQTRK